MDIASLREQIDRKHREALKALETIAGYLTEASSDPLAIEPPATPARDARPPGMHRGGRTTRVDRVLAVLNEREFKTVEQIETETKLPDHAVRAVLYSKFVLHRLARTRINKRMAFKLKRQAILESNGEPKSAAALVREAIAQFPDGLTVAAINAAIGDQIQKMTGSKAAIGAALYNGKKRGKLLYDEESGKYTTCTSHD
jgi:hypothetical protein